MSPKPVRDPDLSTVSCTCGATIELNLASGEEIVFCPDCKETLQLSVTVDPVTKAKRVGVVFSTGALLTRKGRKGQTRAGGAAGDEVHKAKCTCGAQILVDPAGIDSVHTCASCGAGFTAVLKRGKGPGLSTLVLMPVDAMPLAKLKAAPRAAPKPVPRPAPPAKPAPAPPPPTKSRSAASRPLDAAATPAREHLLSIHKGEVGAQAIEVREDGSTIACFCGKEIRLRGEANREIHKCAECGTAYRLFYAFDPRTKTPMVVMLPRPAGK